MYAPYLWTILYKLYVTEKYITYVMKIQVAVLNFEIYLEIGANIPLVYNEKR